MTYKPEGFALPVFFSKSLKPFNLSLPYIKIFAMGLDVDTLH